MCVVLRLEINFLILIKLNLPNPARNWSKSVRYLSFDIYHPFGQSLKTKVQCETWWTYIPVHIKKKLKLEIYISHLYRNNFFFHCREFCWNINKIDKKPSKCLTVYVYRWRVCLIFIVYMHVLMGTDLLNTNLFMSRNLIVDCVDEFDLLLVGQGP